MDARGEGDDVGVDGGAGDAIAALVERVASENEVTDRAGSRERGGRGGGARGVVANGEDDDGEDEQAWMADIDARMATVKDMEREAAEAATDVVEAGGEGGGGPSGGPGEAEGAMFP